MLERQGFKVVEAANGQEGLERMAAEPPALILLDLMMPRMDGFEFATALRQRGEWRAIPVIVMSVKELTPEERSQLDGYVKKILPKGAYSREELLREVHGLVTARADAKKTTEQSA